MNQPVSRRYFVRRASAYSLGFAGLNTCLASRTIAQALTTEGSSSFGPLIQDPEGILDLPQHFSYKIISRHDDKMSDGLTTPGLPDGM
ncbi:MAG: phosphatase, partial [Planctomycetota bacterium]